MSVFAVIKRNNKEEEDYNFSQLIKEKIIRKTRRKEGRNYDCEEEEWLRIWW